MPLPSFEELLSEARRIGAAKTEAAGFDRGGLIASSVSKFISDILTTQGAKRETYTASANPNSGLVSPYTQPQQSGRSLIERMMGVPGVSTPAGQIPLDEKGAALFALERMKKTTTPESSMRGEVPQEILDKANEETGLTLKKGTTWEQLNSIKPEYTTDAQGNQVGVKTLFGMKHTVLPKQGGGEEDKVQTRKDDAARQAVGVVRNYYSKLRSLQGTDLSAGTSAQLGAQGMLSRVPIFGRAAMPKTSQLTGFRVSQGARLAKAFGDSGNIALQEQKNALELLAPPGTRDLDMAEKQALAVALEGIKTRKPEEESLYQEALKAFGGGKDKFDPDVLAYAEKYKITPEQALKQKLKRTGGQ